MEQINILIVEDESIVAKYIQRLLKEWGHKVLALADKGEEAIKKADETRPDIVLMDIVLKGKMDGIEAADQIYSRFDIPVIYLTAYVDQDIVERAKETGPFGYLIKPFQPSELRTAIEIALYKHKMEKELRTSREWLSTTLKSIGDAVIATDKKGLVKFINPVGEKMTGWQMEEATGKPLKEVVRLVNEGSNEEVKINIEKLNREKVFTNNADWAPAGKAGTAIPFESSLLTRDETKLPIEISFEPIKNGIGEAKGLVLAFRDITGRRKIEEEMKRDNLLQNIINQVLQVSLMPISLENQLGRILDMVFSVPGLDLLNRGAIFLVEDDPEMLQLTVHRDFTEVHREACARVPFGKCICGLTARAGLLHFTDRVDGRHEIQYEGMPPHGHYSVPILSGTKILGTLILYTTEGNNRNVKVEEFLTTIASTMASIIERKRADIALQKSEEKYRRIFESIYDVYAEVEIHTGTILEISPSVERLSGYTREELLGKSIAPFYARPESRQELLKALKKTGSVNDYEIGMITKQGEKRVCSFSVKAITGPAGKPLRTVGTMRDVTERKKAGEELAEQERTLRAILDNAPIGIWLLDLPDRLRFVNRRFCEDLGISEERFLAAAHYSELLERETAASFKASDAAALDQNTPHTSQESILFADGKHHDTEVMKVKLKDEQGNPIGLIGLSMDVTERKTLEAQLVQAQKMESIGRLAGGVAHDFKNILTAIIGYSELNLLKSDKDNPIRKHLEIINSSALKAASLIKQLLAFSRKQIISPKVLHLNTIIEDMQKMLGRLIGENIEIQIFLGDELWKIKADRSQLDQIIINLVVNARDSMPVGGKITIETANVVINEEYVKTHPYIKAGDYVKLVIADTGQGMSEEVIEHIFEPFFTTKELGKGTGLGLATVYGIVKQNNGFIDVSSEPGKGTTFEIYLSRSVPSAKRSADIENLSQPMPKGTETILLVEDDENVREFADEVLSDLGYRVITASDGVEALAMRKKYRQKIHLLLTDVLMPKMNGNQLAKKILKSDPKVRILYMSGYTDDAIVTHNILNKGVTLLSKPIVPQTLAQMVREVLDSK